MCRSIFVQYESDIDVRGISAYRFVAPESIFANVSVNPGNLCYCTPDASHCLSAGVLNISSCQMGAPVVSSPPHFYQGDEKYRNEIGGLHPDKEKHQTFLDVEPLSGFLPRTCLSL